MRICEDSRVRFYLLEADVVVEEIFTISNLKKFYQREYQQSRGDLAIFINLSLYSWASSYQWWKVATFDIE